MPHLPNYESFLELAQHYRWVPVYRRLLSDVLTPVTGFRKLDHGQSACLFESVIGGENVGRYSFISADPYMTISAWGNEVRIESTGGARRVIQSSNPLDELRRQLAAVRAAHPANLPPFVGGAVGFAGYDVVRYAERLPDAPPDDRHLPDLSFGFYDRMVIFDNVTKTMYVVAMARLDEDQGDVRAAYEDACRRVDAWVRRLVDPALDVTPHSWSPIDIDTTKHPEKQLKAASNFEQPQFEDAVRRCVEYIRAGDIFQVVISQRLAVPIQSAPFEIYRTLRVVNPSPFMFFLRTPDVTLVGSSPEIMCRVMNNRVTVRPLAGTRPRGDTPELDRQLAEELMADPKERAEHVMLVDLGRNDVGRVAKYGTVNLSDVMTIERYSHVMHITSNVTGELQDGKDAFDALQACLPAGTVSGAPKVRAMEIIDELEPHRRGPYAGAVGYMDFAGNMDTCIALRTMVIQNKTAYVQAGAGIVADSIPANEYQETLNKARGLLRAIAITEQRTQP